MSDAVELQPGEQVLLKLRKHWVIFARDAAIISIPGVLPLPLYLLFAGGFLRSLGGANTAILSLIIGLWLLVAWISLAMIWTSYYLDLWIITDRRVINIDQRTLFSRKISSWRIDQVQEVTVTKRNIMQALFNYGRVQIQTAGPSDEYAVAEGIPDPERVRAVIFEQMANVGQLAAANAQQQRLLHTISHEVKAHLTKDAAALASIVESDYGTVPQPVKQMAGSALAETRKGVEMVMNILSTSDFKSGTMRIVKKPFDFKACVLKVVADLTPAAEQKGLSLECTAQDGEYIVEGDEDKLREHVVRNLVDNAIHYTLRGSVQVALGHVDSDVVLAVTDTGIGITPEDMPHLFTEGGKGAHSTQVNPSSTGFGLFIAKSIVQAHNGEIWARSEGPGHGSRFFVTLPAIGRSADVLNAV